MFSRIILTLGLYLFVIATPGICDDRGLSQSTGSKNLALVIGVSHGLPGIDLDVLNIEKMAKDTSQSFITTRLMNSAATVKSVLAKTKELAAEIDEKGTFFWYFSGHGGNGTLSMQDTLLNVRNLRTAIEEARAGKGPLQRLVMLFDSCYSGSLLDLLRRSGIVTDIHLDTSSEAFVDDIMDAMTPSREGTYWKELFAFASSRANETSNAGSNGSAFTVALAKGYVESVQQNGTIGDLVTKTQQYCTAHHPVARLVPQTLQSEKMKP